MILESVGDSDDNKNVGVSKSNKKDDEGLEGVDMHSERSGIEAREGGETLKIGGNRYSRISRPLPAVKPKASATTQKYPSYSSSENAFSSNNKSKVSPISFTSKK